jgi:hypothetical protein
LPTNVDAAKPTPDAVLLPTPPASRSEPDKIETGVVASAEIATVPDAGIEHDAKPEAATPDAQPGLLAVAPDAKTAPSPETASAAVPIPEAKPTQLAALSVERAASAPASNDDVTESVADSSGATIPVDIGEASSTELPIVLPRERPVIPRIRHRAERRRRAEPRHKIKARVRAKPKLSGNEQPASQVNLFDQLFDSNKGTNRKAATVRSRGARTATTQAPSATNNQSPPPPYYSPFDAH